MGRLALNILLNLHLQLHHIILIKNSTRSYSITPQWSTWVWILQIDKKPDVLVGILGGSVPPASPNPDPISDQKCHFPHAFSDLASKIHTSFQTWPDLVQASRRMLHHSHSTGILRTHKVTSSQMA